MNYREKRTTILRVIYVIATLVIPFPINMLFYLLFILSFVSSFEKILERSFELEQYLRDYQLIRGQDVNWVLDILSSVRRLTRISILFMSAIVGVDLLARIITSYAFHPIVVTIIDVVIWLVVGDKEHRAVFLINSVSDIVERRM